MTTDLTISAGGSLPPVPDHREPVPRPAATAGSEPVQAPAPNIDLPTYGMTLRVDDRTREVIAVIVDRDTNKVIREIPSEEMRVAGDVIRNLLRGHVDTLA